MSIVKKQYTVQGWRNSEGDPRADIIVLLGAYNDDSAVNPAVIAELIRDYVATLPGFGAIEVKEAITDVTETVLLPL